MVGLRHYEEFKQLIDNYQMSEQALKALQDVKLVMMVGATSTGRNTIIRRQVAIGRYHFIVSDTTRPPRVNDGVPEQNGREYWFRTEEQMLAQLKAGEMLEAELIHRQQVSGVSIRELERAAAENKIALADLDLQGVHRIMKVKSDALAVMIVPPSFDEWQRRLAGRGRMQEDEQKRRLETAAKIFEDGLKQDYYHFVISENIEQSAAIIDAIVEGKPNPHQGRAPGLIHSLQESLRQKLDSLSRV
jgi:guanylate kinase